MSPLDDLLLRVKAAGRRGGLELLRYNPTNALDAQRTALIARLGVDLVLDVGANAGQWARLVRAGRYAGALHSFEPAQDTHRVLAAAAAADPLWQTHRVALDEHDGEADLHVAANTWSSSLLAMEDAHVAAAPDSAYVGSERVPLARLEDVALPPHERALLKLDVQGAELRVLRGAGAALERVALIEVELSLAPLYVGAPLADEVTAWLRDQGFGLVGLRPSLVDDASARLLQYDALLARDAA